MGDDIKISKATVGLLVTVGLALAAQTIAAVIFVTRIEAEGKNTRELIEHVDVESKDRFARVERRVEKLEDVAHSN